MEKQKIRQFLAGSAFAVCLMISLRSLVILHIIQFEPHPPNAQSQNLASMLSAQASRHEQELQELRVNSTAVIHALQQELAAERAKRLNAVKALEQSRATESKENTTTPPIRSGVCSLLHDSPLSLWNSHVSSILNATTFVNDHKHKLDDFTARILQIILPRLPKSTQTLPYSQWFQVKRILKLIQARLLYIKHGGPHARKVQITVMGGSVVVGVNCRSSLREMNIQMTMPNRLCSWPMRLESFLNHILGGDVVTVTKVAMGGTNTETGNLILQKGLLPGGMPDVLIHAYSTNDMYYYTSQSAESSNLSLREKTFDLVQTYVRLALDKSKCAPLLIHVDDYLGNEQYEMYKTTEYSQGIQVLANYYGFASINYPNAIRDLVYADTRETWFSPPGWYSSRGSFETEIHPAMAMHMSMAWMVAYNLYNMAFVYCSMTREQQQEQQQYSKNMDGKEIEYKSSTDYGFPPLSNQQEVPSPKPRHAHRSLPPLLTRDLSLENVSKLWRDSSVTNPRMDSDTDCFQDSLQSPCMFGWILGLDNDMKSAEQLFQNYTISNEGWEFKVDYKKWGWIPKSIGSKMVLEFPNVTQPIRSISIVYMKSYGERWKDSTLRVSTLVPKTNSSAKLWRALHRDELKGSHSKNTSESYSYEKKLDETIHIGGNVRVELELVNGATFKVMGLTVCS